MVSCALWGFNRVSGSEKTSIGRDVYITFVLSWDLTGILQSVLGAFVWISSILKLPAHQCWLVEKEKRAVLASALISL